MRVPPFVVLLMALVIGAVHLPPMVWLLAPGTRAAFERRRERGLCVRCGYDLRATVARCPECGEEIEDREASAGKTRLAAELSRMVRADGSGDRSAR
jgi:hypothetical protein